MEYQLSYLIRMGAGKHPQCRDGVYARYGRGAEVVATCAIGAAREALRGLGHHTTCATCAPLHEMANAALGLDVAVLNDQDGLTREAIADMLDALPGGSPVVTV